MSVAIEFQFTPADAKETKIVAVKYIRQRYRERVPSSVGAPQPKSRSRMVTWILYVVLLVLLLYLVSRSPHRAGSPPTPGPALTKGGPTERVLPFLPWILVLLVTGYLIFAIVARLRLYRGTGPTDPPDTVYRLAADVSGLAWTGRDAKTNYAWNEFSGFDETKHLFVIYKEETQKPMKFQVLTVPKRAFSSVRMLEEFSHLLRNNVRADAAA